MFDWSLPGAGAGLLWNILFGKNGNNNGTNGSITPTNTPIVNAASGQNLSAGDLAAVSPNPVQATAAYNFANQNPAQANTPGYTPPAATTNGNPLSNLLGGGGTGNNSNPMSSISGLFNKPQPQVAPVIPPNYAGTGPSAGALQALSPASMMQPSAMPGGMAQGSPLGPAALNPLFAMMRQRLGM
jgi:hypothetical protein